MVYKLFTVILQVFGNSCLVEKFCNWEIPLKPSLHGSVTFLSSCLLLSLYNCCCILGRFSHRNTRSVHTFLEKHSVVQELHKDKEYLHVCISHRSRHCHGSSTHQQGVCWRRGDVLWDLWIPTWGKVSLSGTPCISTAEQQGLAVLPVGKGKVRPTSELFMCYWGLWFGVFCLWAGLLSVCNSNANLCHPEACQVWEGSTGVPHGHFLGVVCLGVLPH